jgi:hypothetical protein
MSEERRKVLDLLAAGKITAEEADRLLERIGSRASAPSGGSDASRASASTETSAAMRSTAATSFVLVDDDRPKAPVRHRLRFLRIVVNGKDEETVNIRVPLAFVRTGLKLSTMLPPKAQKRLTAEGIDLSGLSELQGEELIEALRDLKIDVDGPDGETVRIFCE